MLALISLLIAVALSMLITRIAAEALAMTGISRDIAKFQSLSAFTGVGFTTSESEHIVNHPVRRRIVTIVIRLGSIGIVTVISSLMLTFVNTESNQERIIRLVYLFGGLGILWLLGTSTWVNQHLNKLIQKALDKYTELHVHDYEYLLGVKGGYRIAEIHVQPQSWLAGKSLAESNVSAEGALILGIHRPNGNFVGAPQGDTFVLPGDKLIVYGHSDVITDLGQRLAGETGDKAHKKAVAEQAAYLAEQRQEDEVYSNYEPE